VAVFEVQLQSLVIEKTPCEFVTGSALQLFVLPVV